MTVLTLREIANNEPILSLLASSFSVFIDCNFFPLSVKNERFLRIKDSSHLPNVPWFTTGVVCHAGLGTI